MFLAFLSFSQIQAKNMCFFYFGLFFWGVVLVLQFHPPSKRAEGHWELLLGLATADVCRRPRRF